MDFQDHFESDGHALTCMLWASEPGHVRVRFAIGHEILTKVLGSGNPVHHKRNWVLCERKRKRIEAACRRAFAQRPGEYIVLVRGDFPPN